MKKLLLILLCVPLIGFSQGWEKTFGGLFNDGGSSVQQTTDGGYIITGYTRTAVIGGDMNVYFIKTDNNGNEQWSKTFGGNYSDFGYSVQQTTDGGYVIVGYTYDSVVYALDVYLVKTDDTGNEQWSKTFGGTLDERGYSVQQTTDGGYVIVGYVTDSNGLEDVYLIKTDDNGNVTSEFTIPLNSNKELKKVVDILGRDANPEKNKPFIEIYNDGTVEKKIIIE